MTLPRRSHAPPSRRARLASTSPKPPQRPLALRKARPGSQLQFSWAATISKPEWTIYLSAIQALRNDGVRFLLGGGFALATYTGCWRDTKDIDFYVMPHDRPAAVKSLIRAGFDDYYSRVPYDRKWIHRNVRSNMIVDVIWAMANQRARVDSAWFQRAGSVSIRGELLEVLPLEEMLWCKLYIMQRDHCDWTDIFNLLHARGQELDWDHLLRRLGPDRPLLKALLTIYGWLCPGQARELAIFQQLGLPSPDRASPRAIRDRVRLLDSRAWFAAHQPRDRKLEV